MQKIVLSLAYDIPTRLDTANGSLAMILQINWVYFFSAVYAMLAIAFVIRPLASFWRQADKKKLKFS